MHFCKNIFYFLPTHTAFFEIRVKIWMIVFCFVASFPEKDYTYFGIIIKMGEKYWKYIDICESENVGALVVKEITAKPILNCLDFPLEKFTIFFTLKGASHDC